MPPKENLKNLTYDHTLPPFLRKLQNNYNRGLEGRDGRHESALLWARQKRTRTAEDEAEDEPVYLDEQGNVVGREGKDGLSQEEREEEGSGEEKVGSGGEERKKTVKDREKLASIGGGTKRRKLGKIIGRSNHVSSDGDDSDADPGSKKPERKEPAEPPSLASTTRIPSSDTAKTASISASNPAAAKKKKTTTTKKKVKLSFGDDD